MRGIRVYKNREREITWSMDGCALNNDAARCRKPDDRDFPPADPGMMEMTVGILQNTELPT